MATGRSDDTGYYRVAFLNAGSYTVRIDPDHPFLQSVITPNVQVTAGATTPLSVVLSQPTGPYVRVSGPSSVGIGGTITLYAAVGDANGNPIPNPSVTWTSSDSSIAQVVGVSDTATVTGSQPGYATITATSGGLSGSLTIQVVGSPLPVATVRLLQRVAELAPTIVASWSTTDSTVIYIQPSYGGIQTFVRGLAAGSVFLRATSEGKTGQATITVH